MKLLSCVFTNLNMPLVALFRFPLRYYANNNNVFYPLEYNSGLLLTSPLSLPDARSIIESYNDNINIFSDCIVAIIFFN